MPSKGRQRASRQAQLRNRKRKSPKSQVVDSRVGENSEPQVVKDATTGVEEKVSQSSAKSVRQVAKTAPSASSTLAYGYLGGEIKRIGVSAAIIVALLVALSFTAIAA